MRDFCLVLEKILLVCSSGHFQSLRVHGNQAKTWAAALGLQEACPRLGVDRGAAEARLTSLSLVHCYSLNFPLSKQFHNVPCELLEVKDCVLLIFVLLACNIALGPWTVLYTVLFKWMEWMNITRPSLSSPTILLHTHTHNHTVTSRAWESSEKREKRNLFFWSKQVRWYQKSSHNALWAESVKLSCCCTCVKEVVVDNMRKHLDDYPDHLSQNGKKKRRQGKTVMHLNYPRVFVHLWKISAGQVHLHKVKSKCLHGAQPLSFASFLVLQHPASEPQHQPLAQTFLASRHTPCPSLAWLLSGDPSWLPVNAHPLDAYRCSCGQQMLHLQPWLLALRTSPDTSLLREGH